MDTLPTPSPHATSPTLTLGLTIAGVVIVAAGVGYALGALRSNDRGAMLGSTTNNAQLASTTANQTNNEVPLMADSVTLGGSTVLTGTITRLTPNGFELEVTSPTLNTVTRAITQRTVRYSVKLTSTTQLTQYTFTSAVPTRGGSPEITQSISKLTSAGLTEGAVATVTTSEQSSGTNLVALAVRLTTLIKK